MNFSSRMGDFVKRLSGYRALVPRPLPPRPSAQMDGAVAALLGQRNRVFCYTSYWRLLQEPEPTAGQDVPVQTMEAAG